MDIQDPVAADRIDQLLIEARAGDARAYAQFLARAARLLRSELARKIAGDSELEDIVQECLIAVHAKRHTLDPGRPVGPWLRAVARYKLVDHWRRRGRSPLVFEELDLAIAAEEMAEGDVMTLLQQLPEAQAQAIRMTHIEGLTSQEASDRAGIGLSALKLRVHRGMNRLKGLVADKEQ